MQSGKENRYMLSPFPVLPPFVGVEKLAEDYTVGRTYRVDGVWFAKNYADEQNVQVTIVRRDGPIAVFMLGDVSEAVLRLSGCTVWAVKPMREEMERVIQKVKICKTCQNGKIN